MKKEIIIRDWHLKRGDIVYDGIQEFKYIKMDGMYAQYETHSGEIVIGLFNFLIKGEGNFYIPYQKTS